MKPGPRDSWALSTMPGMPGGIRLYREAVLTQAGLSARLTIYPATIVQARYGGLYEGAPWVCFPVHVQRFAEPEWRHWDSDEIECGQFWRHAQGERWLIGLGKTPGDAYDDLISQVCARLNLDRAMLAAEQPEARSGDGPLSVRGCPSTVKGTPRSFLTASQK